MWSDNLPSPTPHDLVTNSLSALTLELSDEPTSEKAHIAIIEFADRAAVARPLTRAYDLTVSHLNKGIQTDYLKLFSFLGEVIRNDIKRLKETYEVRPVNIFILTDGEPFVGNQRQPKTTWLPARNQLTEGLDHQVNIIAFGFGDIDEDTLTAAATAYHDRPLAFASNSSAPVSTMLDSLFKVIVFTVSQSVQKDELVVRAPEGMRQLQRKA